MASNFPPEEKISHLAHLLEKQMRNENVREKYATVKRVLTLLGAGTVLALSFIAPPAIAP